MLLIGISIVNIINIMIMIIIIAILYFSLYPYYHHDHRNFTTIIITLIIIVFLGHSFASVHLAFTCLNPLPSNEPSKNPWLIVTLGVYYLIYAIDLGISSRLCLYDGKIC